MRSKSILVGGPLGNFPRIQQPKVHSRNSFVLPPLNVKNLQRMYTIKNGTEGEPSMFGSQSKKDRTDGEDKFGTTKIKLVTKNHYLKQIKFSQREAQEAYKDQLKIECKIGKKKNMEFEKEVGLGDRRQSVLEKIPMTEEIAFF